MRKNACVGGKAMSTPDIRAALAAEPVEEELSAVTTSALLHPAYEPGDGSADGAQMVRLSWWHPVMGCDSLQIVVDNARNILRNRWGHPATPPAPEPGEVGEIADHILAELQGFHPRHRVFGELTVDRLTRAATLLQQLSAPAPVVVPRQQTEALLLLDAVERAVDGRDLIVPGVFVRIRKALGQPLAPAPVVVSVALSDALIKAECALSDVAEGEPECYDGDPAQWAEQRCAETLAIIRPAMKQHKIRTSEWPPQPLPQVGEVQP
jgi:hypothetical protein